MFGRRDVAVVKIKATDEAAVVDVELLLVAFTAAWNVASWPSPGFIAITMSAAQCESGFICLQ